MANYTESDFDTVNQRNLKALDNGGTISFMQVQRVIAIGNGHKREVIADLEAGAARKGSIKITKGSGLNPGTLEVTNSGDRREFEQAMKRISKKKVVFK